MRLGLIYTLKAVLSTIFNYGFADFNSFAHEARKKDPLRGLRSGSGC